MELDYKNHYRRKKKDLKVVCHVYIRIYKYYLKKPVMPLIYPCTGSLMLMFLSTGVLFPLEPDLTPLDPQE